MSSSTAPSAHDVEALIAARRDTPAHSGDRLPRVLVLLASHNGAESIERQIRSVLAQRGVEVLLEVRDDGSSDATTSHVTRLAAADVRVFLHADRMPSGSAASNFFALMRTARPAEVDYVALCDQDDEWLPDKLDRAIGQLRSTGCAGYSSAVQALWPDGRTQTLAQVSSTRMADYLFEGAGQGCTFVLNAPWFAEIQRQLELLAPLLPRLHYHDWLLYALTRSSKLTWCFDPEPRMLYHQHAANDTGARTSLSGVLRRLGKLRDGWYSEQVQALTAAVRHAHPDDAAAVQWQALTTGGSRLRRIAFVAQHGRRRISDRMIQIIAIAFKRL